MHDGFIGLSESWPLPFRDIEKQFSLIGQDLQRVQNAIETIRTDVGKPIPIDDVDMPDMWCAIEYLSESLADLQATMGSPSIDLTGINKKLHDLEVAHAASQKLISDLRRLSVDYEARFSMIGPVLMQCKNAMLSPGTLGTGGSHYGLEDLQRRLSILESGSIGTGSRGLEDRLARLELQHLSGGVTVAPTGDVGLLRDSLAKLSKQVETLERRVVGDGLSIGMYVFQSFEDLRVWMKQNVKNNRYGLFVDVVALFELFCTKHVDTATTIGTYHSSQRTGFTSMYESTLAASMLNVLPTLLGKGSTDGLDTSRFLPGLTNADKWSHNGVSGLCFQIERELPNVDSQLGAEINTVFRDFPEAAGLARECLFRSKIFIAELCQFITNDLEFWVGRRYSRIDAWALVCQSIRRIFEEIHSERVYGRHVKSTDDDVTAAKYLWAVLKAHKVMQEFSTRDFTKHPSISAVVARHLAMNHMKPDEDKKLEAQVRHCETSLKDLARRFDTLDSRVTNKLGKLDGGGGGGGGKGGRGKQGKGEADP
mmetsp:Transcript_24659/g.35382  ORF Transcript_24659/g.35382 Transcript_24659/m.35382 type:complete len:538 (+) Transcript_24659:814-2427(+)